MAAFMPNRSLPMQPLPPQAKQEEQNFSHLVYDIGWFSIALAATTNFLGVYALRLGAADSQVTLMAALPAFLVWVSCFAGQWWHQRSRDTAQSTRWPSFLFRLVFLLPAATPLMPKDWQIAWLLLSVTLPALAQGVAMVTFTSLMRESVKPETFPNLFSRRTMALNLMIALGTIGFALWLELIPFPFNYQSMFLVSYAATMVSLWHVWQVRPIVSPPKQTGAAVRPWRERNFWPVARQTVFTYMAYFASVPLIIIWLVNRLEASELFIGLFGLVQLGSAALAATYAGRWRKYFSPLGGTAFGMGGTAVGTALIVLSPAPVWTLLPGAFIGACWAMSDIGMNTYFAEKTPPNEIAYSEAFLQALTFGMFFGPILVSGLSWLGLPLEGVLALGIGMRAAAGLASYLEWRGERGS
jgi:MFS family permease